MIWFPLPPPLISLPQNPGGGKGKWRDRWSNCHVIWSDCSQWDARFQDRWCTHAGQTHSPAVPEPFTSLLLQRETAGDALTATAERFQGLWTLWFFHISLLASICPSGCNPCCYITKHPSSVISVCDFGQVTQPFTHLLIHLMNIYWVPSIWDSREGNSTPLQYSCLENLLDGGAW